MKKPLVRFGIVAALLLGFAAYSDAITYVRTIVGAQKFKSEVLFEGAVTMENTNGTISAADGVFSDDLTVADDAAVTGDLAVTGTTTINGGLVSGAILSASKLRIYHGTTTLTEGGGAETVLTLTNATTEVSGLTLFYRVRGTDATDHQGRTGLVHFTMENKAGTTVSGVSVADETGSAVAVSSGTFTYAITTTNAANASSLKFNIDSSLTLTAASMEWIAVVYGPGTIS